MKKQEGQPPQTWYVVFCDEEIENIGWWHWFTRPGFRHVFAFSNIDGMAAAISIEQTRAYLRIKLHANLFAEVMADNHAQLKHQTVVKITRQPRDLEWPVVSTSCVWATRAVLGITDGFILTPWQLFRRLMREGGKIILPGDALAETEKAI